MQLSFPEGSSYLYGIYLGINPQFQDKIWGHVFCGGCGGPSKAVQVRITSEDHKSERSLWLKV